MVQQRLHKLLMKDTVETPTHQPGMEDHGVEPAPAVIHIPASVEGTGMDEKTIPRLQVGLLISRSHQAVSLRDHYGFPFLVPVPGNIRNSEIVFIAGNGKGSGAMFQQFPSIAANGGITFCQCHSFLLYDGFVLEKWRFSTNTFYFLLV
jgi:hypothetical protein